VSGSLSVVVVNSSVSSDVVVTVVVSGSVAVVVVGGLASNAIHESASSSCTTGKPGFVSLMARNISIEDSYSPELNESRALLKLVVNVLSDGVTLISFRNCFAIDIGMAKFIPPTKAPVLSSTEPNVLTPITSPYSLNRGPPELP